MAYEPGLEQFRFYREMQLWPISRKLNYENWLANFDTAEDRELALQVLDHFIYIPADMMTQMLQTVVGKCGYFFQSLDSHWTHSSFETNCWYSFIPGENTTDRTHSGYVFIRMLREELGISDERIVDFTQLINILECNHNSPQNVILVDDFVGSGAQCDTAYNKQHYGVHRKTLREHVTINNHRVAFAPLIVNEPGFKRIQRECVGLHLECVYKLGPEYNLLNRDGLCWDGDEAKYSRWLDLLQRISQKEGFPFEGIAGEEDVQGFHKQCLALAFEHCIPDACSSIFFKETGTWKPLKSRPEVF